MRIEVWNLILTTITTIALGCVTAWASVQKMKWENRTQRWEDMTQRAVESSETAAKNTFVTQNLIRENTDITMQVADQTNGRLRELAEATKRGAVLRARMHERVAASGDAMAADDLDHMEKEFQQEEQQIKKETTAKNNET